MVLNTDAYVVLGFLLINIILGLYSSKGIKNIREYAVGTGNFSTSAITCTIVATWITGSAFINRITETYQQGLYFIWPSVCNILGFLFVGLVFAPRLGEFIGKLSIADAMGTLYGKKVRVISAFAACIGSAGLIAAQLKVSGMLIEYGFNIPSYYGVIIAGVIVGCYSALGGIKSVTFTDIIQLITFCTIIPAIAYFIFNSFDSLDAMSTTIRTSELFNYKEVFDFTRPKSFSYLLLFLYFFIPGFEPAIFQRVSMAKNTAQIKKSFIMAGVACFCIYVAIIFIGLLLLAKNPNIARKDVFSYLLLSHNYVGLKGIIIAGVMAMVMSTADSIINSNSVLIVHDIIKPLKTKLLKNELIWARIASFLITIVSLIFAINAEESLLKIIMSALAFYMPVVTMPFIFSVFGFRSSGKSVLIAMSTGFIFVSIGKFIFNYEDLVIIPSGMIINSLMLFGSHYLLKQSGGFVGIKDQHKLELHKKTRNRNFKRFFEQAKDFNLMDFLAKSIPKEEKSESVYLLTSIFCMILSYAMIFTLDKSIILKYSGLIDFIYLSTLFIATFLLGYPIWPNILKKREIITLFFNFTIFYVLAFASFTVLLISNFALSQSITIIFNLFILSALLRWELLLLNIVFGIICSILFLKCFADDILINLIFDYSNFKISYFLMLSIAVLLVFIRPKQEESDLIENKKQLLEDQMIYKNEEVNRSFMLKNEIINNLSHEIRSPLTGIVSIVQCLYEDYDRFTSKEIKNSLKTIYDSSERLKTMALNMLDLSELSSLSYKLKLEDLNLSKLLLKRIEVCSKLYNPNRELEFVNEIEDNIILKADQYYITTVIDNIVVNAIKYSKSVGIITISLKKEAAKLILQIKDEGIGIPQNELDNIFELFRVSSRTYSKAGGRGVGLTLCKKAVELHGGEIFALSDGVSGSEFCVIFGIK